MTKAQAKKIKATAALLKKLMQPVKKEARRIDRAMDKELDRDEPNNKLVAEMQRQLDAIERLFDRVDIVTETFIGFGPGR